MKALRAFIKRHPLLSYFVLAFAITWSGFVLAVGPGGIPATPEQFTTMPLGAILAVLVGPSASGILLTGLLYGREGLRALLARMTRWRVGTRWYAVAILTAPLVFAAVLLALSPISPAFLPGIFASEAKASFVLMGIVVGLIVGTFEELGWTGFAVPTLLRMRYGVLGTGLIVGVLWGVFHWPVNGWAGVTFSGALPVAVSLPLQLFFFTVAGLTAYRILMVWVYERTGESLLVAILMHASLTASMIILTPVVTGVAYLTFNLALTALLWVLVGAVAVANHGHLSRQPPPHGQAA
jgi:membrane protease YdiL (CAAX protease family)